jgi:hypothetical protein
VGIDRSPLDLADPAIELVRASPTTVVAGDAVGPFRRCWAPHHRGQRTGRHLLGLRLSTPDEWPPFRSVLAEAVVERPWPGDRPRRPGRWRTRDF